VPASKATSVNRSDYAVSFNAALRTGGLLVPGNINLKTDISATKLTG